MAGKLNFIETLTIEQFKARTLVSEVKVLHNKATDKLFFSYGAKTGAVSAKGIPTKPMVSYVQPEDGGEPFWLLHNEGEGGAEVKATF